MLFCISLSPHGNKFQPELLFLSPKFHSFKSKPLCLSLLLYLLLVSMVTPLSALYTIYLSLRLPSLSLSLGSYLSHFAFISASLPPALSNTLLTRAFISFHFHLSFTFLSPSSLPFHHAVFSVSYLRREKSFICCPINSAFLIIILSLDLAFPTQALIYMCDR